MLGDKGGRVKSYTMEPWPSYDMTSRTNNGNRTNEIENKFKFSGLKTYDKHCGPRYLMKLLRERKMLLHFTFNLG